MCIIAYCDKKPISADMVRRMMIDNRDGIGIGWNERGSARWIKGLTSVRSVMRAVRKLKLPYVVHARYATVGTGTTLTHPFPIEPEPSLALEGIAPRVLFHNGHVHDWRALYSVAIGHDLYAPDMWSDTRAIAAVLSKAPDTVLDSLGGRFLILDGRKAHLWGNWTLEYGIRWSTRLPLREPRRTSKSDRWFDGGRKMTEFDWERLAKWEGYSHQSDD